MKALLRSRWIIPVAIAVVAFGLGMVARPDRAFWLRNAADSDSTVGESADSAQDSDADDHSSHDHDHPGHEDSESLELSSQALKNIGFRPVPVALETYNKTVTLPAMIVERPGRTQFQITAPLAGIVTRIHAIEGAAVEPGSPLFDIRLTHEELVASQREFLRSAENLDVVRQELKRLKSLNEGIVPGKRILEQEYEIQKIEGAMHAERQGLLLHGLTEAQVDEILNTRKLVQSLTAYAPQTTDTGEQDHLFHVQRLEVTLGQHIEAGQVLGVLADHCELFIEGKAFDDDAERLRSVAEQGRDISATLLTGQRQQVDHLKLLYLADHVDPDTRAFLFYLQLPNEIVLRKSGSEGLQFIQWKFKPGQRLQLHVPMETLEQRIVLPTEAVVDEGAESYVFRQNGTHFDRVPVHVEHRNEGVVVIANDGSLFPGDVVAGAGAHQMYLALKNKAGGGIDPHAGHNH